VGGDHRRLIDRTEGAEVVRQIWPVYGEEVRALFLKPLAGDLGPVRSGLDRVIEAVR
jgi:hypothetical protein